MRYTLENLKVYQEARELVRMSFLISDALQQQRRFALSNQLEKTAISIASNIAEGKGSHSKKIYLKHINIAIGSAYELECQLDLAKICLDEKSFEQIEEQLDGIIAKLYGLQRFLVKALEP
jgi:four helix bundle protein